MGSAAVVHPCACQITQFQRHIQRHHGWPLLQDVAVEIAVVPPFCVGASAVE
jgi:hypothetical protein